MISPGPVVITATFVGYLVAGFWGSLVSTIGIFLPSFLLVLIAAPLLARHRGNPNVQGFVKGAYAAAIGTILGACILLGRIAIGDWLTALDRDRFAGGAVSLEGQQPASDRSDRRRRPGRLSDAATELGDGALADAQACQASFKTLGICSLPIRWISIQALATSFGERTYGWTCLYSLCACRLRGRLCQRLFRLRHGPRRIGRMAAHHHADANRHIDRRLWSAHARLRHIQTAPYSRLAEGLAARAWDDHRHTDRRQHPCLPRSRHTCGSASVCCSCFTRSTA